MIGLYPLLNDDTCRLLAIDFDEGDWKDDASAFVAACRELSVPAALEVSRSGKGAHVWIFFVSAIPAVEARRLGAALISRTCAGRRQLELSSYDRFIPNQDRMPAVVSVISLHCRFRKGLESMAVAFSSMMTSFPSPTNGPILLRSKQ